MKHFDIQQGKGGFCLKVLTDTGATGEVMMCRSLYEVINQIALRVGNRSIDTYAKLIQSFAIDIAMMEHDESEGDSENRLLGGLNGTDN